MDTSKKDGLIAQFQCASGIEDMQLAVAYLEQAGWDIGEALRTVLQDDPDTREAKRLAAEEAAITNGLTLAAGSDIQEEASSSKDDGTDVDLKHIEIQYLTQSLSFHLPLTMTVGELQTLLFSETELPPCSQSIRGFSIPPTSDKARLGSVLSGGPPYRLIVHEDGPDANPVGSHNWRDGGWTVPEGSDPRGNSSSGCRKRRISSTDVAPYASAPPTHPLISVRKDVLAPHPRTPSSPPKSPHVIDTIDLIDSDDDFEDATTEPYVEEEEIFIEQEIPGVTMRPGSLIPDNVEEEEAGAAYFVDSFKTRYGASCPSFYPGTLEEAISIACLRPAKDRKLLAIYIHHDASVLTNVFCTELLCCESVLDTLSANFLIWGWDITNNGNKAMLLTTLTRTLSAHVSNTIRDYCIDHFPALMIVTRNRGNTELLETINGNIGVNELLSALIHAVDIFSDMQAIEMKEEEERAARERIVNEQDRAYQESLKLDRAKEEAKRKQEKERNEETQRLKKEKEEEEERRKAEVESVLKILPPEPSENTPNLMNLRFRCPNGSIINRRFNSSDNLNVLFNYLLVNGFRISEFKLLALCPRRDFSEMDRKNTLQDLHIHSQETLILEER